MATTLTEQSLRSTYKDDYRDSDNYHHILFNAGRALQARELTQLQTLLQKEINRFGTYVLQKDGVEVYNTGTVNGNQTIFVSDFGLEQGEYTVLIASADDITFSSIESVYSDIFSLYLCDEVTW